MPNRLSGRIKPVKSETELKTIERLAREIWHEHYSPIVSKAQIEYMLDQGYSLAVMQKELCEGIHYDGLYLNGNMIGYCSFGRETPGTLKLHKLYLKPLFHGQGFGRQLLEHVLNYARRHDYHSIVLQVNKQNQKAIRAYTNFGFAIKEASIKDIGGGFIMDDFVMELSVS